MSIYSDKLNIGASVSFTTYIPALVGGVYSNVEVMAIMGYSAALNIDPRITALHETALTRLPVGTPANPKSLTWVQVRSPDGTLTVLAFNWINPDTLTVSGSKNYNITIENASPDQIERLRRYVSIDLGLGISIQE